MPISTPDQELLRAMQHVCIPYFDLWPEISVETATVNAPSGLEFPLAQLPVTWTGDFEDVLPGMRYVIHRDGTIVTQGIVRLAPESNTFYIDAKSLGDSGLAESISTYIQHGDDISIYNDYPLWTLFSRINKRKFFKQWDIEYTSQGSNPPPVCNMGAWRHGWVDGSGEATFTFTAAGSFAWNKTVTDYLWILPAAATIISGGTNSVSVTFSLPPGFYTVRLIIGDSGVAVSSGIRPVWVYSDENPPLSMQLYGYEFGQDTQTLLGRSKQFTLYSTGLLTSLPYSVIDRNAALYYWEDSYFNGQALTSGVMTDRYVGFTTSEDQDTNDDRSLLNIQTASPFVFANELPNAVQAVIERVNSTKWIHVNRGYGTPDFIAWYVAQWHCPNLLRLFDFVRFPPTFAYLRKKRWALNGRTVQQQMTEATALVNGNVGSASDGTLFFFRNPMHEDNTFRNNMEERATLEPEDLAGNIAFPVTYRARVGQTINYAFAMANNKVYPLGSVAPGSAQGQGGGINQNEGLLVVDQVHLDTVTGHMHAESNDPIGEYTLTMNRNYDIFDPARHYNVWWRHQIPGELNPRANSINRRTLVTQVTRTWAQAGLGKTWLKKVEATFKPETFGQPGTPIDVTRGAGGGGKGDGEKEGAEPEDRDEANRDFAVAWTTTGGILRTYNFRDTEADVIWTSIKQGISGVVNDVTLDPFSEYISSGFTQGTQIGYAVVASGTAIRLYKTDNILAEKVTWTLQSSDTMSDSNSPHTAQVLAHPTIEGLVIYAWRDRSGTYIKRSADFGETFAAKVKAGTSSSDDNGNDNQPFGITFDGDYLVTTGRTSTTAYHLFYAAPDTGSFTQVTGSLSSTQPHCPIKSDELGSLYVGRTVVIETAGASYSITFDAPPGIPYTISDVYAEDALLPFYGGSTLALFGDAITPAVSNGEPGLANIEISITFEDLVQLTDVDWDITWFYYWFVGQNLSINAYVNLYGEGDVPLDSLNVSFVADDLSPGATPAIGTYYGVKRIEIGSAFLPTSPTYLIDTDEGLNGSRVGIDNIDIVTDLTIEIENKLYIVGDYAGTSVWNSIEPDNYAPHAPDALAVDLIDPFVLYMLADNDVSRRIYESLDGGDTWTQIGSEANVTPQYRGTKRVGDIILNFGTNTLDLRLEGALGSPLDRRGNMASVISGGIGTVLGMIGTL